MIKRIAPLLGLALLLAASFGLRAAVVPDLYSAQVPVTDQSSAALAKASRVALAEVMVKVSGSMAVLQNPGISAALGDARSHVQQYSFARGDTPDAGLLARIEFDSAWVTQVVIEAEAPLWTANRPAVLVWLVEEGPGGRQFISPDTSPVLLDGLQDEFSRRGVSSQLPLFDLADAAALTPDRAWTLQAETISAASARYKLQAVLAGRVARLSSGGVAGDWLFLHGGERVARAFTAENEELFFRDGVAMVAETMAARYAVTTSAAEGGLVMLVSGVTAYADYAAIVSWLESLELIERANVEWVRGDTVQLRLLAQADARQLAGTIELNQRLVPVVPVVADTDSTQLNYQWQN